MLRDHRIDLVQAEVGMSSHNQVHVPFEVVKRYLEYYGYTVFGLYEQIPEWQRGSLRRANGVFLSVRAARKYETQSSS